MSNYIADGLPLGLRFYDTLGKQARFKYQCRKGVLHKEYQYTDLCTLPPFQVLRVASPLDTIYVTLVCLDDETEVVLNSVCPALTSSIVIKTIGAVDYISYLAVHDCCNLPFTQALVYIRLEDGVNTWYSEPFWVYGDLEDAATYYRDWSPAEPRTFDNIDLRTWR